MDISQDFNQDFELLLDYLKQNCCYDLTLYKRNSLMRRFQRRMQQLNIESYTDYLQYLIANPSELTSLLHIIFINFSSFFRDVNAWNYIAYKILPQIIASKKPQEKIRVWSAGCAGGQEVYTLAMLLIETLGVNQYLQRVQIFATDVDEDALSQTRQASYSQTEIAGIPSELLAKYFQQVDESYIFCNELRSPIISGHHNLAFDAPMSKIDLLVCRNVLIYFNPKIQASVFVRFHFALNDRGFLFIGGAESVTNKNIFTSVSIKHRVFTKGENLSLNDHLSILPHTRRNQALDDHLNTYTRVWKAAFDMSPFAQIAINNRGFLILANKEAYELFDLNKTRLGTNFQDLNIGNIINVITIMKQLKNQNHSLHLQNLKWNYNQNTISLDIHIQPIVNSSGKLLGANFTFVKI
jgi:two-component system, chemotaxis family, CheB/CheR fusion protein